MSKFTLLTLLLSMATLAPSAKALSISGDAPDPEAQDALDGRPPIEGWNLAGGFDLRLQYESVTFGAPQRQTDFSSGGVVGEFRGRAGDQFERYFGLFLEGGASLYLGGLSTTFEDARPSEGERSKFSEILGLGFEFGGGISLAAFDFSLGVMVQDRASYLGNEGEHYVDPDGDTIFERQTFDLNYGYWSPYFEARYTSGRFGGLGGSGVVLRLLPVLTVHGPYGEIDTWGASARFQYAFHFGGPPDMLLYSSFGLIGETNGGIERYWWFSVGVGIAFGN